MRMAGKDAARFGVTTNPFIFIPKSLTGADSSQTRHFGEKGNLFLYFQCCLPSITGDIKWQMTRFKLQTSVSERIAKTNLNKV